MSRSLLARWRPLAGAAALAFVAACNEDSPTAPPVETPIAALSGRVVNTATGGAVSGAAVTVGSASATTDSLGRFQVAGLAPGQHPLRVARAGFADLQETVSLSAGLSARDLRLTRVEWFDLGDFAMYVPPTVDRARGILLSFGGPNTKAYTSASLVFGAPLPAVEANLHVQGAEFRALAAAQGFVVMGTSRAAMANSPDNDAVILDAIRAAAQASGLAELTTAPIIIYGLSGGAAQSSGFAARNAGRMAGLFLKVPAGMETLTSGPALGVPTFVTFAENDAFINNAVMMAKVQANRASGALWGMGMERGVPHHSLSPAHRALTTNWIGAVMALRTTPAGALRPLEESSGWLGNPATRQLAPWAAYTGDRMAASWLPDANLALQWATFIGLLNTVS